MRQGGRPEIYSPHALAEVQPPSYNARLPGAGWSSLAARRAHNPKVAGSNPAPATIIFGTQPNMSPNFRVHATAKPSLVLRIKIESGV